MKLKELKLPDIDNGQKYHILLPIGATEQHGPFAPYGTDTYITEYLVDRINEKHPEMLILPMLEFSRSREHRGFFGTVWLTEETLYSVFTDILNSLSSRALSFSFLSFHANEKYIETFINATESNIPLSCIRVSLDEDEPLLEEIIGGVSDGHGGNSEISNILVLKEKLATIPPADYKKTFLAGSFSTDNLIDFSKDGISDNNPNWNVNKEVGQKTLDVYEARVLSEIKKYINL